MQNRETTKPKSLPNPAATPEGWPEPLREEGLYGIAGEYVNLCAPYTESDPIAVLAQLYAGFGNLVGSGPYVKVQFTEHRANIYVANVGDTAKSRKGTSWDVAATALSAVDPEWRKQRVFTGASSGEGLIAAVSDGSARENVADKRALFFESELARTLKAMGRHTSTLSPVLRQGWDSGNLRVTTRQNPLTASGAHISLVAHCTKPDLDESLPAAELKNGLGNRFQWYAVHRPHLLPWGTEVPQSELRRICQDLKRAARKASKPREIKFSPTARSLWIEEYPALTADEDGVLGAVTARGEAQVVRLALICALMNESSEIQRIHLQAALAIWKYASDSARFLFGNGAALSGESKLQPRILDLLRKSGTNGVTRTEISAALNNHYSAKSIGFVLDTLKKRGVAECRSEPTMGRPVEKWFCK